ncbi:hypothetical protein LV780_16820 [Cereibacter azotoformans]|uniref:Glutathione S-transferase n=1 Tax=Cereibacter azotoformans TaxID=43057 RepID=A0A2T5JTJ3_9RHOB|nr:hypothetical protein [Cereibacter azotoformans]AXQ95716.1 hypothetical protein D0Z66_18455 [Cereibacter sphaeroides]PTR12995.1 hypothetical protein C8J28_12352 [Cereibacter azotoformans]UIJ32787.1 hypothetical protein LV780_16820 [Cereibacter azotoformans]
MDATEYRMAAEAGCPVAQRAALALACRSKDLHWSTADGLAPGTSCLSVHRAGRPVVTLYDSLAMIELIEDLHPDQPLHPADPEERASHRALMALALRGQQRLALVTRAAESGDYDIAMHFLSKVLHRIEAALPATDHASRPSNLDIVLAPLLWRILVLDRAFGSYIGISLLRCKARARWLLGQPEIGRHLNDAAAEAYIASVARRGAVIAARHGLPYWMRALGPEGGEKRLAKPRPVKWTVQRPV